MNQQQPQGLRARRKTETQREVQEALLSLLQNKPLADLTVAEIAAQAGISTRTFFRYFHAKEAALVPGTTEVEEILARLQLSDSSRNAQAVYQELLAQLREHFSQAHLPHRDTYLQVQELMEREPSLRRYVGAQEMVFVEELIRVIARQARLDDLKSALVAESALAVWRLTWREWGHRLQAGKKADPAMIFDKVARALSDVIGK